MTRVDDTATPIGEQDFIRAMALCDVTPCLATSDVGYCAPVNAEIRGDLFQWLSRGSALPDRADIFLSKLRIPVCFSWSRRRRQLPAPLAPHVQAIVGFCPKEKMVRIDACAIVAGMTHAPASGVGRWKVNHPADPVRLHRGARSAADAHISIAGTAIRRPNPAGSKMGHMRRRRAIAVDFLPETRNRLFVHAANLRVGQRPGRVAASPGALMGIA